MKIKENIPEITLLTGLFFICTASFILNYIVGLYVTGVILCGMGIFLAKKPIKK